MKFVVAILVIVIIIGMISAQVPESQVEMCMDTLKEDLQVGMKIQSLIREKKFDLAIKQILANIDMFERTKNNCSNLEMRDIEAYVRRSITTKQEECLVSIREFTKASLSVLDQFQRRQFAEGFESVAQSIRLLEHSVKTCETAFTRRA